ncbi:MAG: tRNA1(Val) (adenine(37)-N6)-methyltransferase [Lachnospiraceae bacterium]|nr:tRNA1(Val) (adenine(37)-N6)-methyltransferase [Lachnospiraceae bacterium]
MEVMIKENERIDDLQYKGLKLIQDPELFCFGMDAVLLANFAKAAAGDTVIDLCTGNGVIPILMSGKTNADKLIGVEIQKESAELAERSVKLNGLSEKVKILNEDICRITDFYPKGSVDVVTCNPPYMIEDHGLRNDADAKTIARHEIMCTLKDVVSAASAILKTGGMFYMVHRPFRLTEIMVTLQEYKLEPKRMRLVYPYVDKEPSMVLIEAKRDAKPRITVEKPFIIYESPGVYTEQMREFEDSIKETGN